MSDINENKLTILVTAIVTIGLMFTVSTIDSCEKNKINSKQERANTFINNEYEQVIESNVILWKKASSDEECLIPNGE